MFLDLLTKIANGSADLLDKVAFENEMQRLLQTAGTNARAKDGTFNPVNNLSYLDTLLKKQLKNADQTTLDYFSDVDNETYVNQSVLITYAAKLSYKRIIKDVEGQWWIQLEFDGSNNKKQVINYLTTEADLRTIYKEFYQNDHEKSEEHINLENMSLENCDWIKSYGNPAVRNIANLTNAYVSLAGVSISIAEEKKQTENYVRLLKNWQKDADVNIKGTLATLFSHLVDHNHSQARRLKEFADAFIDAKKILGAGDRSSFYQYVLKDPLIQNRYKVRQLEAECVKEKNRVSKKNDNAYQPRIDKLDQLLGHLRTQKNDAKKIKDFKEGFEHPETKQVFAAHNDTPTKRFFASIGHILTFGLVSKVTRGTFCFWKPKGQIQWEKTAAKLKERGKEQPSGGLGRGF